jgi:DNA polymerase-1
MTSKGLNTSAALGFANTLYDVLKTEKPTHIGIAFDSHGPTVRHAQYAEYKAQRENTPEDIVANLPYIHELIEAFGIPILQLMGYEADDIIGTFAKKAEQEGLTTYMMTTDKDYGQLVSEHIFMYKPSRMGNAVSVWGMKEVCEQYGIENPGQLTDILGIWGDAIDNIPGIKGVGEVGAKKLVKEFGSIENMLAHVDSIKNDNMRRKVREGAESALLSKQLATIILDVPLPFNEEELMRKEPDMERLRLLFEELEFKSLANRVFADASPKRSEPAPKKKNVQTSLFPDLEEEEDAFEQRSPVSFVVNRNRIDNTDHQYHLVDTLEAVQDLAIRLSTCSAFGFDTETTGLDPLQDSILGISFCIEVGTAYYVVLPKQKEEAMVWLGLFSDIFRDKNITKIGQNMKFDVRFLTAYGLTVFVNCFDTLLAHYLVEPEMKHNLDYLALRYFNYEMIGYDSIADKVHGLQHVSLEKLKDYACQDADMTFRLKQILEKQLRDKQSIHLFTDIEMPLVEVLCAMEDKGVYVDIAFLKNYSHQLQGEIEKIQSEIYNLAGEQFNISSPKQLGVILFEKLRIIDNVKLTKSKQYQTGEDVLQKLQHKHPIIDKILQFRGLTKLKSTYVDSFPDLVNRQTKRIHASFNQAVTVTGRLSSSRPNLQNIPIRDEEGRQIRKAFIPENEQFLILAADYSQIELRLVAAAAQDENMLAAFYNGEDIHAATASRIYNVGINDITKEMRRNAKTVNFGIIYGISAFGLSERLNISRREAADLIEQYVDKYPSISRYIDSQIAFARQHGYVETLMKRRRYLRNINSANVNLRNFDQRNAINAPIQGSAADLIKIAMIDVYRELKSRNFKSSLILQVHDELILEVHRSELEQITCIVEDKMTHALELPVPLEVEIKYGDNWLAAY